MVPVQKYSRPLSLWSECQHRRSFHSEFSGFDSYSLILNVALFCLYTLCTNNTQTQCLASVTWSSCYLEEPAVAILHNPFLRLAAVVVKRNFWNVGEVQLRNDCVSPLWRHSKRSNYSFWQASGVVFLKFISDRAFLPSSPLLSTGVSSLKSKLLCICAKELSSEFLC